MDFIFLNYDNFSFVEMTSEEKEEQEEKEPPWHPLCFVLWALASVTWFGSGLLEKKVFTACLFLIKL